MTHSPAVPEKWRWFPESRYGLFLHWGPYAAYGRGEQVLFREHLDPCEYEAAACAWRPDHYDPALWAETAKKAGSKYAVLTTRHHDGYCLWDTATTDYSSAKQAPQRDLVREFADAFRAAGLRIGLYYSLLDWRIPAWSEGPEVDAEAWTSRRDYIHAQVEELLTDYGEIDLIGFDGVWPRNREDLAGDRALSAHPLLGRAPHPPAGRPGDAGGTRRTAHNRPTPCFRTTGGIALYPRPPAHPADLTLPGHQDHVCRMSVSQPMGQRTSVER